MIFTTVLYGLSDRVGAPFVPWMGWICVWSGLMHICLACAGAVELVKQVQPPRSSTVSSRVHIEQRPGGFARTHPPTSSTRQVTSFSGEVFGLVISVAYVYDAVEQFFPLGAHCAASHAGRAPVSIRAR